MHRFLLSSLRVRRRAPASPLFNGFVSRKYATDDNKNTFDFSFFDSLVEKKDEEPVQQQQEDVKPYKIVNDVLSEVAYSVDLSRTNINSKFFETKVEKSVEKFYQPPTSKYYKTTDYLAAQDEMQEEGLHPIDVTDLTDGSFYSYAKQKRDTTPEVDTSALDYFEQRFSLEKEIAKEFGAEELVELDQQYTAQLNKQKAKDMEQEKELSEKAFKFQSAMLEQMARDRGIGIDDVQNISELEREEELGNNNQDDDFGEIEEENDDNYNDANDPTEPMDLLLDQVAKEDEQTFIGKMNVQKYSDLVNRILLKEEDPDVLEEKRLDFENAQTFHPNGPIETVNYVDSLFDQLWESKYGEEKNSNATQKVTTYAEYLKRDRLAKKVSDFEGQFNADDALEEYATFEAERFVETANLKEKCTEEEIVRFKEELKQQLVGQTFLKDQDLSNWKMKSMMENAIAHDLSQLSTEIVGVATPNKDITQVHAFKTPPVKYNQDVKQKFIEQYHQYETLREQGKEKDYKVPKALLEAIMQPHLEDYEKLVQTKREMTSNYAQQEKKNQEVDPIYELNSPAREFISKLEKDLMLDYFKFATNKPLPNTAT